MHTNLPCRFACADNWSVAHAAHGQVHNAGAKEKSWDVIYQDLLLSTRLRYVGKIRIKLVDPSTISVEVLAGRFASKILKKQ